MELAQQTIDHVIDKYESPRKGLPGLGPLYYLIRLIGLKRKGQGHVLMSGAATISGLLLIVIGAYFYGDYYIVNRFSSMEKSWRNIDEYQIWYYIGGAWVVSLAVFWIAGVPTLKFVNDQVKNFDLAQQDIDGFEIDLEIETTSLRPPVYPHGSMSEILNGLETREVKSLGVSTFMYLIVTSLICSGFTVVEGYVMYFPHFDSVFWGILMLCNRLFWSFALCMIALPWYAVFALAMVIMDHKIRKIHVIIHEFFKDTVPKTHTDFDYIRGHRHKLSAFADGLSRRFWRLAFWSVAVCAIASVGFTFRAIQMDVEEVGQLAYIFVSVVLLGFVVYVLSFASLVYSSSCFVVRYLNDIRDRSPIRETYEASSSNMFNNILKEFDGFINHCKDNPIGFRLHNLYVTPQMVKAIIYALLSIISIFLQLRFGRK